MHDHRYEFAVPWDIDATTVADAVWLWRAMEVADVVTYPVDTTPKASDVSAQYKTKRQNDEPEIFSPSPDRDKEPTSDDELGDLKKQNVGPLFPPTPALPDAAAPQPAVTRVGALRTLTERKGFKDGLRGFCSTPPSHATLLDETATVDDFVAHGLSLLVPKPQRQSRRWMRLSLVVEATPSNALWQQSVDELEVMVRQQGSFRQVRHWALTDSATGALRQVGRHGALGRDVAHLAKAMWWKDEIVIIVSDFTSAPWWNGVFARDVRRIANHQPLLMLHTLPQRLWHRSWTGMPDACVCAPAPACTTAALQVFEVGIDGMVPSDGRLALPIIAMRGSAFFDWSRALMERTALKIPAMFVDTRETYQDEAKDSDAPDTPDAIVTAYKMASSALARRLASYMAIAAPLTFPMMRWVQRALLRQSDASHLAEFVLGGLLRKVGGDRSTAADDVVYDFIDGVREVLQVGIPISHAIDVLRTVGVYLEANQDDVLDARTGVATWSNQDLDTLSPSLRAFAIVSRKFLERIGLPIPENRSNIRSAVEPRPDFRKQPPRTDAYRSRNLKHAVMDLQWSSTTPGLLAVLHEGGVEVWDTQQPQGILIGREATEEQRPRQVTLYWIAGEDWTADRARLGSIRSIIGRIADGLRFGGGLRLSVIHIKTRLDLETAYDTSLSTAMLIVFESVSMGDAPGLQIGELNALVSKRSALLVAVRLDDRATHILNAAVRTDLSGFMFADETDNVSRRFTANIGKFIYDLRVTLAERLPGRMDGASAICWIGHDLALAERHGNDCTISQIAVTDIQHEHTLRNWKQLFEKTNSHVHQLCFLGTDVSGSAQPEVNMSTPPLAWTDGTGALYFEGRLRASGSGAMRLLAPSDIPSTAAVSNHAYGINLVDSATAKTPKRVTRLLPANRRDVRNNPLAFFTGKRPIAIATDSTSVQAVTSNGYLHRGRTSNFNDNGNSNPAPFLDQNPLDLGRNVRAAAFCLPLDLLCVSKPGGMLELWNTRSAKRLDGIRLAEPRAQLSRPVVAISPDGQLLALAHGRSVNLFRVDKSGSGFADSPKNRPQPIHMLWVDDHPDNNIVERDWFREKNIVFTLVRSTGQAMLSLRRYRFAGVISDMGRKRGAQEGFVLLDKMRTAKDNTPVFFYAGSNAQRHKEKALARGAQGSTNNFHELVTMVMDSLAATANPT